MKTGHLNYMSHMKKSNQLTTQDHIAFGFNYNGGEPDQLIVAKISVVYDDSYLVHFMYGHHSLAETIKHDQVIAVGNPSGMFKFKGWTGRFDIYDQPHPLIQKKLDQWIESNSSIQHC